MEKSKRKIAGFFGGIGSFFREFGEAAAKGDLSVKLSMIWMGAGYARRGQYVKSVLITIFEALVIVFSVVCSSQYIPKFGTLGTVKRASEFNPVTMKNEINDYDDSFMILLFSVVSIVIWAVALAVWMSNVRHAYELQKMAERGEHINTFREDLNAYRNEKFYKTLLALPVAGVVIFTAIPLLILILVAFTNYDQQHMPPTELFTWVGLDNFINLFGGGGLTITFGYSFVRVLIWTLVWAVFSTFTTETSPEDMSEDEKNVAYVVYGDYCGSAVRVPASGTELFRRRRYCQYHLREYRPDRFPARCGSNQHILYPVPHISGMGARYDRYY